MRNLNCKSGWGIADSDLRITEMDRITSLGKRFNDRVLSNPKSFVRRDHERLSSQYRHLVTTLRSTTPYISTPASPSSSRQASRRPSTQIPVQPPPPQAYWNEYNDGSEAEYEPYTILVNPEAEMFSGVKTFALVFSRAKMPIETMKEWLSPGPSPGERQSLLTNEGYFNEQQSVGDADIDDEAYASFSEFPAGYATHYATFPSKHEQEISRHCEQLLFQIMLGCFFASTVPLAIAGTLVAIDKKTLQVEVDAAVLVGVLTSLFFATLGIGAMLYRQEQLSWLHRRVGVGLTFVDVCVLNGVLLVIVQAILVGEKSNCKSEQGVVRSAC
jgi:hypothetical protein